MLSGSLGFDRLTPRVVVSVEVSPSGVCTNRLMSNGACMPHRGSGPCTGVVTVPSGAVMVVVLFAPKRDVVTSPVGAVVFCR